MSSNVQWRSVPHSTCTEYVLWYLKDFVSRFRNFSLQLFKTYLLSKNNDTDFPPWSSLWCNNAYRAWEKKDLSLIRLCRAKASSQSNRCSHNFHLATLNNQTISSLATSLGTGYVESAISAPGTESASHETIYDVTLFFLVLTDLHI